MRDFFKFASEMSAVSRYSQSHLMREESVLEHTGFVVLCVFYIMTKLLDEGERINCELVMCRAAVHDMDEVITGDVARPTKYDNPELTEHFKRLEAQAARRISDEVFESETPFFLWETSKEATKEGYVLRIADAFAVAYKCYEERITFGNQSLREHARDLHNALSVRKSEAAALFDHHIVVERIIDEVLEICLEAYI